MDGAGCAWWAELPSGTATHHPGRAPVAGYLALLTCPKTDTLSRFSFWLSAGPPTAGDETDLMPAAYIPLCVGGTPAALPALTAAARLLGHILVAHRYE